MNKPKYKVGDKVWLTTKVWCQPKFRNTTFLYTGPILIREVPHRLTACFDYGISFPFDINLAGHTWISGEIVYFDIKYLDKHSELID